jgi:Nucleotide-diphospho-sugar transferase
MSSWCDSQIMDGSDSHNNNHPIHHRRTIKSPRSPIVTTTSRIIRSSNPYNHDGNTTDPKTQQQQQRSKVSLLSPLSILTHLAVGVATFHIGLVIGSTGTYECLSFDNDALLSSLYHKVIRGIYPTYETVLNTKDTTVDIGDDANHTVMTPIFPSSMTNLLYGAATIRRDSFIQEYDVGVPWNEAKDGATDVLLLYQNSHSLPSDYHRLDNNHGNAGTSRTSPIHVSYDRALDATTHCHSMKVLLMEPNTRNECIAVVPQWESFHVQHFLRIKPENMTRNKKAPHFKKDYPLRLVSRHDTLSGKSKPRIPMAFQANKYYPLLLDYLTKLSSTLGVLKPIVGRVATSSNNHHRSKTVVVMVCNHGQSELFMNFVCSARARKIDLSNVLLFATDEDTYLLAKSLDIHVFNVDDAFGDMPTGAAKVYGDRVFQIMMLSKVYCVQLVSALGYDVLFQDVDVVWYRNPTEYFQSEQSGNFDFYFQDGACVLPMYNSLRNLKETNIFAHYLFRRSTFDTIHPIFTQFRLLLRATQRSNKILLRRIYADGRSNYR